MFRPGDLVVRTWSKATTLKRKVYRVTQSLSAHQTYGSKVEVIDAFGNKKEFAYQEIQKLDWLIYQMESEIKASEMTTIRKKNELCQLKEEIKEIPKYLPLI